MSGVHENDNTDLAGAIRRDTETKACPAVPLFDDFYNL